LEKAWKISPPTNIRPKIFLEGDASSMREAAFKATYKGKEK